MPAVDPDVFAEIQRLYDRGLFLQAQALGIRQCGPLTEWSGSRGGVLAGRLANQLGSSNLGERLHLRAHRRAPRSLGACSVRARCLWGWRGAFLAWEWLSGIADDPEQSAVERVDLLTTAADILGTLHDFSQAEERLRLAESLGERGHWVAVSRAQVLEGADRLDEAEQELRRSLTLLPWYRPAVQGLARLLYQRQQDDEAIALMRETMAQSESAAVAAQLASVLLELRRFDEARTWFDRYAELTPLRDRETSRWLAARRADLAYESGDLVEGLRLSRASGHPFHLKVAEAQEQAPADARRVLLDVPFVRQHNLTCAPATLAMLARFWQVDADHLAVAEAICYDGTPDHKERGWAEASGFIVREFTVTWEVVIALIDRGIPFTLTTVETTSAHLQAVVGYDARRQTLLIRDPGTRYHGESRAEHFLKDYAPFGPRGMLLVPRTRAQLLDGLELPEVAERDLLHALRHGLDRHDRMAAAAALAALETQAPDSRLTLMARRNLAYYDGDHALAAVTSAKWHAQFPEHQTIRLMHLDDLPEAARAERQQRLEEAVAQPSSLAIFAIRLASQLWWDQRHQQRAEDLLRRALRRRGSDAAAMHMLAGIQWERRDFTSATAIYRLCASLEITDEDHAQSYFRACRHLHRTEEALTFLRQRAERAAKRSPYPTRTLFWALDQLDRTEEGFQVIEAALVRHGEDGYLLRFLAREQARVGRYDLAVGLLQRAEGRVRRIDFLAASADLADKRGDRAQAITVWEEVLTLDPLFMEAHRSLARLREETAGRAAAITQVRAAAARFSHHRQLQVLLVQWLRDDGPAAVEPAIRHLVSVRPGDAWGQRELAWCLQRQGRLDEAQVSLDAALQVDGICASNENLRGDLLLAQGDLAAAQAAWCTAVRLDADDTYAIDRLMETVGDVAAREQQLRHVQAELERQVTFGDGIESFRYHAQGVLPAEAVLHTLQSAHTARPDLWQVWSSLIIHLLALDRLEEADRLASGMCARFPLLPRSWLDQSKVAGAQGQREVELAALDQALQISPSWSYAARRVAELHLQIGDTAQGLAVMQRIINHDPLDAVNHLTLARVHVAAQDVGRAVVTLERAVTLDPGLDRAWDLLSEHDQVRAMKLARAQTDERGHEARAWFRVAKVLVGDDARAERLAALDRALERNPRMVAGSALKADLLAEAGRIDEALAGCAGAVWQGHPPSFLRRRAAVIESRHGRGEAALVRLRALVADEPEDGDNWRELAGIAQQTGQIAEAVQACEQLIRLQPRRAVAWGYLADARSAADDRAGTKAAFIRAVELDPSYAFAGHRLFDLHLADHELTAARIVLSHLQRNDDGDWTTTHAVEWHAANGDAAAAGKALAKLLDSTEHDSDAVDRAVAALAGVPQQDQLVPVLDRSISSPLAGRRAYYHWAQRWVPIQSPRLCAERIDALPDGRPRLRATFSYVTWLGEHAPLEHLQAYVERSQKLLHANDECWGAVCYARCNKRAYRDLVAWISGWQKRSNLEAWMLIHVADACRTEDRWSEALEAHHRAEALPRDRSWQTHTLWLAVEASVTGDAVEADRYLVTAEIENEYLRTVLEFARLTRRYLEPRASSWKTASDLMRLVKAHPAIFANNVEMRHLITRLTTLMGKRSNLLWRAWGWLARWYASEWKLW